jgi:phospholipid/cholesterol/gamma-HCH transport system substrate-binding protein
MTWWTKVTGVAAVSVIALASSGCGFDGINGMALPGAVGRGPHALKYHIEIANVATLESNSPVMIGDVVVGSVSSMTFDDWHANVEVSVEPGTVVAANAVATVGQTSLLGSMHLALDPPVGQPGIGRLQPDSTLPLNASSTYPSTEQTLSSLSAVANAGGLGQIGDVIHNVNAALSGNASDIRQLLTRLTDVVGVLDEQRDSINSTINSFNRLSGTVAGQTDVIETTLRALPPALNVLLQERPRLVTAMDELRRFSDTATSLVHDTRANLVDNLKNLEPTLRALADVGNRIDVALGYATIFPYTQDVINRGLRGDYMNEWASIDLTIPRLKKTLFLGTRWGDPDAILTPAPGEPYYGRYTLDPIAAPVTGTTPPPATGGAPPAGAPPLAPILPIAPPAPTSSSAPPPDGRPASIFAGPYDPGGSAPAAPLRGGN